MFLLYTFNCLTTFPLNVRTICCYFCYLLFQINLIVNSKPSFYIRIIFHAVSYYFDYNWYTLFTIFCFNSILLLNYTRTTTLCATILCEGNILSKTFVLVWGKFVIKYFIFILVSSSKQNFNWCDNILCCKFWWIVLCCSEWRREK